MGKMMKRSIYQIIGGSRSSILSSPLYDRRDSNAHVMRVGREAMKAHSCYAMLTLEAINFFNSAICDYIKGTLAKQVAPSYLDRLIKRLLWYKMDGGAEKSIETVGIIHDSKLEPLLWNILSDGVLGFALPEESTLIGCSCETPRGGKNIWK